MTPDTISSPPKLSEKDSRPLCFCRRGAFVSVAALVQAIEAFLAAWNTDPQPFVWTAKLEDILRKIERARAKLESLQPGCTQPRRRKQEE